mgnify:CR=1 FL=1
MPTETDQNLSTSAAAHINHAMAAIYLIGGIFCIAGFFGVGDIPVKALIILCAGLGILLGGMALLHLCGYFTFKTFPGAALGIAFAAISMVVLNACSSYIVSQMKQDTREFEAEMRANCERVDEKTYRTRQDLRDACKGFRE